MGRVMTKAPRKPRRPDQERLRHEFDAYILGRGLCSTEQRRVILDAFFDTHDHVTIDTLLKQVQMVDAGISYATVYRTMKLLSASGVAQEHQLVMASRAA